MAARSASTGPRSPGPLAAAGPKRAPAGLPAGAADAAPTADGIVGLDELVEFLEHPVQGFLRQRLGLSVSAWSTSRRVDALPVELGRARRAGPSATGCCATGWPAGDLDRCRQAEWRRGELPPGALGDALLSEVLDDVEPLVAAVGPTRGEPLPDVDVDVALPDGRRLVGTVGGLYGDPDGPTLLRGGVLPAGPEAADPAPGSGCSR